MSAIKWLRVGRPDHFALADITYIPMASGFFYLTAVVDWFARRVLGLRVSITPDIDFCIDALEEALAEYGRPIAGGHLTADCSRTSFPFRRSTDPRKSSLAQFPAHRSLMQFTLKFQSRACPSHQLQRCVR